MLIYFPSLLIPHLPSFSLELEVAKESRWILDIASGGAKLDRDCEKRLCQCLLSVCKLQGQQVLRAVLWQWWPATFPMWPPCLGSIHRCQSESNDPVDFHSKLKSLTWTQGAGEADWMLKPKHKEQSSLLTHTDAIYIITGALTSWVNEHFLIWILFYKEVGNCTF